MSKLTEKTRQLAKKYKIKTEKEKTTSILYLHHNDVKLFELREFLESMSHLPDDYSLDFDYTVSSDGGEYYGTLDEATISVFEFVELSEEEVLSEINKTLKRKEKNKETQKKREETKQKNKLKKIEALKQKLAALEKEVG